MLIRKSTCLLSSSVLFAVILIYYLLRIHYEGHGLIHKKTINLYYFVKKVTKPYFRIQVTCLSLSYGSKCKVFV